MDGAEAAGALLAWADVATSAHIVPLCERAILGCYYRFVDALHTYLYQPSTDPPSQRMLGQQHTTSMLTTMHCTALLAALKVIACGAASTDLKRQALALILNEASVPGVLVRFNPSTAFAMELTKGRCSA